MLTPAMRESIESLSTRRGRWYVFDSELMHNKTRNIKDVMVVFDILVYESKYLVGSRCEDRIGLLHRFLDVKPWLPDQPFEQVTGHELAVTISDRPNLWCIKTFSRNLKDRYQDHIELDEVEGLVLKNRQGTLDWGTSEANNASWQVRCRKSTKNYSW